MSIVKGAIPIRAKVVPPAEFTQSAFCAITILSDIFINRWYEIQDHIAPVSNIAMIASQSRSFIPMLDNCNLVYSKFEVMWACL